MDRNKSPFELRKIAQVSTNKVGIATYMDAFDDPLEKVRFQAVEYATGKTIQAYIDFGDFLRIADDIKTGRLFRKMDETKQQETLSMGGSVNSSEYNGEPESRIISLGKMNDKIFINISRGHGKLGSTGLIMPDGQPDMKLSVGMSIDDCRSFFILTDAFVRAFLAGHVSKLMNAIRRDNAKFRGNN